MMRDFLLEVEREIEAVADELEDWQSLEIERLRAVARNLAVEADRQVIAS